MRRLPTALALLLATAAGRDRVPEATPAGPPVSCIRLSLIRETQVRDDRTIDWLLRDGHVYRNVLPSSCPELGFEQRFAYETSLSELGFEQRFAYETSLSELCSTDIITVIHDTGITRGASCGLGPFQPVTLASRSKVKL